MPRVTLDPFGFSLPFRPTYRFGHVVVVSRLSK